MSHQTDVSHFADDARTNQPGPVFGFEDFWREAYSRYGPQFDAIADLMRLGDGMVEAADESAAEPVKKVVCGLTRMTIAGAVEAVVLCGNGCGPGAMKIVRGMYESRWTAEYLRRHPEEVEDYLEFSKVLRWRRLHWLDQNRPGTASKISPRDRKQVEDDYNQAKAQFTDSRGRVRFQWSSQSIREMATDVGRDQEYELPYSIVCSIHHGNFEGLARLFDLHDSEITPDPPPSMAWIKDALLAAHTNLWFALTTLNEICGLGFGERLEAARKDHARVWQA